MSYCKAIKYGNYLDIYCYEKEPYILGRSFRKPPRESTDSVLQRQSSSVVQNASDTVQSSPSRRRDNVRRARLAFERLIQANLIGAERPFFITLTFASNMDDLSLANSYFRLFISRFRFSYGKQIRYIAVPEYQKRGAVHYHIVVWGLPKSTARTERHTRRIANLWRHGFCDVIQTDGSPKIAGYMGKYLTKNALNNMSSKKTYFTSLNVLRPEVHSGIPYWYFEDEYSLCTAPLLRFSEYMTQWMGRGVFTRYLIE